MTLPTSGPLSLEEIAIEFEASNPVSLGQLYAGGGIVPSGATGTYGPVPTSGAISIQNFYGTSNSLTYTYYIIGAGGTSGNDTSGGASGAGAAVGQLTVVAGTSTTIIVGQQGAASYNAQGGTTSIIYQSTTIATATGGFGNTGPPCGFCTGPVQYNVGTGSGGSLQLSGGYGGGWNNNPQNGGDGALGYFNNIAYYAAGGGGSGSDFSGAGSGGTGGSFAGGGGTGFVSGHGTPGGNYGGGGGGAGNYGGGAGAGAGGVSVITYVSSTQRATGGVVTSSGSGENTVWQHVFTASGSFVVN